MIAIESQKSRHRQAFFISLIIAAVVFLPFVIQDRGYFIFYGDFNVQQIPFYQLAHRAVRSGDIWWSWYTDLGANFIGSYSFYLLFSPFFWLTLAFPTSWVPYLMAPLLVLKTACASFTAYFYLERFVRDKRYAVIGALLYAFSGWMDFNIFFNHFHDVAVFFPLLLLGVEKAVTENKRGFFAVSVVICAVVNYWFFVGEVVFVLLYILARMSDRSFGMTPRKFGRLSLEAVLGVGMAAVVLLPSVLAIMGNPRTGGSELLSDWSVWLYWHEQRQPAIIQSLFFPPELSSQPNFFPDHGAKWASLSGWLPLFAMTGVLAYFIQKKRDWLKKMLGLSLLFALVPVLNSLFILLNHSYYARWYYMPILLMSLATIRTLEDSGETLRPFRKAIVWSAAVVGAFAVICGLTPNIRDDELRIGMAAYPARMWIYVGFAAVSLGLTALLVLRLRGSPRFQRLTVCGVALVSASFLLFYIASGRDVSSSREFIIKSGIKGGEYIHLPEDPFGRTDVYDEFDNLAMFWELPNIQAFHSIVPPSIMEFYPTVGVTRDVGSRPQTEYYSLRSLLSVRWLFIRMDKENQEPMPGFTQYTQMAGYNIYQNENYIPMGFGYTQYITRSQLEELPVERRGNAMVRAVVLEDGEAEPHGDILTQLELPQEEGAPSVFDEEALSRDAADRRMQAADSFSKDNRGFTARTSLGEETLLFFSVPAEKGWSAAIDGKPAEVYRVNVGFMAVRVPPGEHEIRFSYVTPGLLAGAVISGAALALFLGYLLLTRRLRAEASRALDYRRSLYTGQAVRLSWAEYLDLFQDRERRKAELQRTLNQASAGRARDSLDPGEKTLRFEVKDEEGPPENP